MRNVNENKNMSLRKLRTQAQVCAELWRTVCVEVFGRGNAADRVLSGLLRAHRGAGSRDRRFYAETIFGFFRGWGVLRGLLSEEKREKFERTGEGCNFYEESALLLGGALFAFTPLSLPLAAQVWADGLKVRLPGKFTLETICETLKIPPEWSSYSRLLPEWSYGYIDKSLNPERLGALLLERPPLWLRAQCDDVDGLISELGRAGVNAVRHPLVKDALAVYDTRINLYTLEGFRAGRFEIQDLASQEIGLVCAPRPGERWWDACAGAGGKSLQLAQLMRRKGTVVASDIREYKLEDLRKRARRAGFPNIRTKSWDGGALRYRDRGKFDGVLVDAPCSCSGTWRRNPDGRWILREEEVKELAELQLSILLNASSGVKPGGVLIYGTCSMFSMENTGVVEAFLAGNGDFELEEFISPLTGEKSPGYVLADMGHNNSDAMFAARLRRKKN